MEEFIAFINEAAHELSDGRIPPLVKAESFPLDAELQGMLAGLQPCYFLDFKNIMEEERDEIAEDLIAAMEAYLGVDAAVLIPMYSDLENKVAFTFRDIKFAEEDDDDSDEEYDLSEFEDDDLAESATPTKIN